MRLRLSVCLGPNGVVNSGYRFESAKGHLGEALAGESVKSESKKVLFLFHKCRVCVLMPRC